jgi:hypothetical protein
MRRNLAYHITPFDSNDTWLKNVAQLRRRWSVFTGQKIVSVATGRGLVPFDRVKPFLPDPEIEWLEFPNSRALRESVSLYPMLRRLSPSAGEATFYGHAKGVTRDPCDVRMRDWRNNFYKHLLDRADECMKFLETHVCVGAYRQHHNQPLHKASHLTQTERNVGWHYAGTMMWFRNADVLSHPRCFEIQQSGWMCEFWLPQLFTYEQSACIYRDNTPDPYRRDHDSCPDPADWPAAFLSR